ncbi:MULTISPECIES: sensor histidine kinase [Desulfococcus]|uniref:histidine kinase n=1 Tax=Desulfococcus multivorans DSM 2059 TaxID=1121405 RepID=S7TF26_DESML|nr:ATP-binding protein [Desulfococcus multivorans]AOY59791.1 putative two component system sensor histidine kinase [Desulfococcus multivorans]AQV01961.1 hypothetical protein B2D07_15140 [Desulfococcus multivorans]EPR35792.1 integral membrane sensor signal transduction histidine kinase [Desulfococcus multivorans DSM 2059]SJZ33282.1 Signal transduction histidine kinase [Desulfococcus multivorans DSM 2059]
MESKTASECPPAPSPSTHPQPESVRRLSRPLWLLSIIALSIFLVEAFNMILLNLLPPLPLTIEVMGDALLLIVLVFPTLYRFSYKPLLQHIERRKQAETELKKSEQRLRRLSNQLLTAQEIERREIAAGLHDEMGPKISALKFRVEAALQAMNGKDELDMERQCRLIVKTFQELHEEIRVISKNLSPLMIDELGLRPALDGLCDSIRSAFPEISIETEWAVTENDLPQPLKIVIYRVVQEALANMTRHSRATRGRVSLRKQKGRLFLEIRDNGIGFNVDDKLHPQSADSGIGLPAMCERVTHAAGAVTIDSSPDNGTTIIAVWDIDRTPPDRAETAE